MSIGEPSHPMPPFVGEIVAAHAARLRASTRPNDGTPELLRRHRRLDRPPLRRRRRPRDRLIAAQRHARGALQRRHRALARDQGRRAARRADPEPLLPGLRRRARSPSGAEPVFVPATAETGFLPDYAALPADAARPAPLCLPLLARQPAGRGRRRAATGADLLALAERHDFRILADECYAEIYRDAPAARRARGRRRGRRRPRAGRWSSTRSPSARTPPGLRSGFVAGGPRAIAAHAPAARLRRRAAAAAAAARGRARSGRDEAHVEASRALYREKFALADRVLGNLPGYRAPEAGFFLWLRVGDGEAAALRLWRETGVRVLPGGYLGRATPTGANPGAGLHPRGAGRRRGRGRRGPRRDPRHARAATIHRGEVG